MALSHPQNEGQRSSQAHDPDDIRAEYSALAAYFNTVVTFRFTTLGFFLAAVGLVLAGGITWEKAIVLLLIDTCMFIIEVRNRSLYDNLSSRGMQIERDDECRRF